MATLVYNGYSIPNIIGKIKYNENYQNIQVIVDFLLIAESSSALITLYNNAREKLTEKNKDLVLSFGIVPSAELDFSHNLNTGFLSEGSILKLDSELSTETTRHCSFICKIKLPFSQSSYNYRQNASFNIEYLPTKIRVVNFNITYTAGGANSAYQNYNLYAKTWCESILARFGSIFEIIKEKIDSEQEEKILTANIIYKEIISNQKAGSKDNVNLIDIKLVYKIRLEQKTGYPISADTGTSVHPSSMIQLDFLCPCNKETLTDITMSSYYHNTIRPYIISRILNILNINEYSTLDINNLYFEREEYAVDIFTSLIVGKLDIVIPPKSKFILFSENYSVNKDEKLTTIKLWDGQDNTYSVWTTGSSSVITRIITIGMLDQVPIEPNLLSSTTYLLLNREVNQSKNRLSQTTKESGVVSDNILYLKKIKEVYLLAINNNKIKESYIL
jgi:hypothetical protein